MGAFEMRWKNPREFQNLIKRLRDPETFRGEPAQEVLEHLAETTKDFMVNGIKSGRPEWEPLSEVTKAMKGHGKPLQDTGDMLRAIAHWNESGEWKVGIPAGAKEEVRAGVQEHGAHIPVTPGVRKVFATHGIRLRADTKFIRIPARPWLAPAVRELERYVETNLADLLQPMLKKLAGQ